MPITIGAFDKLKLRITAALTVRKHNRYLAALNANMEEASDEAVQILKQAPDMLHSESGSKPPPPPPPPPKQITAQELYKAGVNKKIADRQSVATDHATFRKLADMYGPARLKPGYDMDAAEWAAHFRVGGILDEMVEAAFATGLNPRIYFITHIGSKRLKRVECVYGTEQPQILWLDAGA